MSPELVFVGHGAERSGPPVYLDHLVGWLAANTDLDLATALVRGGPLVDAYRAHGPTRVLADGRAVALAQAGLRRLAGEPASQRARQRWLRRRLGDWADAPAVYVNTVSEPTLAVLAEVAPTATVVLHVHELEAALRYGIDDDGRRLIRDRPDYVVAASQAVADNLVERHGLDPDRIVVHHEFVRPVAPVTDEERRRERGRLGIGEDAFLVVGSGMLEWRKAPELFVRLAADLRERTGRDLAFVWVGGTDHGPLWAPLDHEARHLGVEDVVRFVGGVDDPGRWFRLADAFVLTSREDAFPLAALEAASAAVPVVTFDTGGMVELVGEVAPEAVVGYPDTVAMADRLAELAGDEDGRADLASAFSTRVRSRHVTEVAAPALWADLERWLGR